VLCAIVRKRTSLLFKQSDHKLKEIVHWDSAFGDPQLLDSISD